MDDPTEALSKQPLFDAQAWRYFGSFFRGQLSTIALAAIASIFQAILILPIILLIRFAFDVVIPGNDIALLMKIGAAIFGLNVLSAAIAVWGNRLNIKTVHAVIFNLRKELLLKLYVFSRHFYTNEDLKIVHARIVQDTERLGNLSNTLISKFLAAFFLSLTIGVVLVFLNGFLFSILLLLFPVLFFLHHHIGKHIKKRVVIFQRAFEQFSRGISFTLGFIDLIRVQAAEHQEKAKQTESIKLLAETSAAMHFFYALNSQLNTLIIGISSIVIIIFGAAAIANRSMSIGDLFAFYLATGYLYRNISIITDAFVQMVAGNASMITLRDLSDNNQIQPEFGTRKICFSGNISFDGVSFRYGRTSPILSDVNLRLVPGSVVAIIGDNGSGKTTLINLILGFYRPTDGSISADGVSYQKLDMVHLRDAIGIVMQSPFLFSGTIRENITFGAVATTTEALLESSKFAGVNDFVQSLPHGYDTPVGEEGNLLSGGQCQKVAIARALLRRPKLLILDEPTNHLDNLSIQKLVSRLDLMDDKPAILIVSHDMSVVNHADVILRIENGKLIELMN